MLPYYNIPGPVYPDDCGHGGYICSFRVFGTCQGKPYEDCDLYVFANKLDGKQAVCIRHGTAGDYYSPGTIENVIRKSQYEPYTSARLAILHHGTIKWEPKS